MLRKLLFLLALLLLAAAFLIARPAIHLATVWWNDPAFLPEKPAAGTNDISRLSANQPGQVIPVEKDPAAAEAQLIGIVRQAADDKGHISISGARHSMGGHVHYPGGIVLDMLPFDAIVYDEKTTLLTVGAGARWSQIIPVLDRHARSVAVMQSNNDFTVGGSISVNCHGWQNDSPPIDCSVESFRLLTADGAIRRCSRTENPELFKLTLGGFGLFGVILDVQLRTVPNEYYHPESRRIPAADYYQVYREMARTDPDVRMAYGRISVAPDTFLREAIVTVFKRRSTDRPAADTLVQKDPSLIKRIVFRGSVASDYGKNLRWTLEKMIGGEMNTSLISRNQILNEGSEWFSNRDPLRTEILHEYFIPVARLAEFLEKARPVFEQHHPDLLNITVRNVEPDTDSFLRYAREEVFGLVMLFNQGLDEKSETAMKTFTRALIDVALDCGGTYYLPYRPHATLEQFKKAYPQSPAFFARKLHYDPAELFANHFYQTYGKP